LEIMARLGIPWLGEVAIEVHHATASLRHVVMTINLPPFSLVFKPNLDLNKT
jgi:hypothetical protein